jgi:glycosyltransferase involved in cell wall biosynthesis
VSPPATILQIIPRLDTGGAELSTLEIVQALTGAGGRALVATEGGRLLPDVVRAGGEIIELPAGSKNPLTMLANAGRLANLVGTEGIGLLHARSRAPAWSAYLAARRAGCRFVTTYHGAYNGSRGLKNFYNGVMGRGDIVIANSEYTASLIRDRHHTPPARLRVIHRGVDLSRFAAGHVPTERTDALRAAWGIPPGHRIILQAARLTSWKGQAVVIEAARRLRAAGKLADTVVVLAGDEQGRDGYRAALASQIREAGLDGIVRLVGHCADMPAAYTIAALTVVASVEPEAFGRAVTEASAMGCPVIATAIGAPPETVVTGESGRTGWLVAPGDPQALADTIAEALALDGAARARLAESAIGHVEQRFSVTTMQRQTLAVYDELLGTTLAAAFDARTG